MFKKVQLKMYTVNKQNMTELKFSFINPLYVRARPFLPCLYLQQSWLHSMPKINIKNFFDLVKKKLPESFSVTFEIKKEPKSPFKQNIRKYT